MGKRRPFMFRIPNQEEEEELVAKVQHLDGDLADLMASFQHLQISCPQMKNWAEASASSASDWGSPDSTLTRHNLQQQQQDQDEMQGQIDEPPNWFLQIWQRMEQLQEDLQQTQELIDKLLKGATEINDELIFQNQIVNKKRMLRELKMKFRESMCVQLESEFDSK